MFVFSQICFVYVKLGSRNLCFWTSVIKTAKGGVLIGGTSFINRVKRLYYTLLHSTLQHYIIRYCIVVHYIIRYLLSSWGHVGAGRLVWFHSDLYIERRTIHDVYAYTYVYISFVLVM